MKTLSRRSISLSISTLALSSSIGHAKTLARGNQTFYVANAGSDSDNGKSAQSAWQTISRVNKSVNRGDTILFNRGDIFYGRFSPKNSNGNSMLSIEMGAYGDLSLELPVLSLYKLIKATAWRQIRDDIWAADINDLKSISGNTDLLGSGGANVGHICIDGIIYSDKKSSLSMLVNDWSFYSDQERFLYVKSPVNPAERAKLIGCAPAGTNIGPISNFVGRDLIFEGSGGNAFSWSNNADVDIQKCWIRKTGGSYLPNLGKGTIRYGNGAQCFPNCSNINVSNCLLGDIYDAALTCQGFPVVGPSDGFLNIQMNNNIIYRSSQAVELWDQYGSSPGMGTPSQSAGFHNCSFMQLVLIDMQRGPMLNADSHRGRLAQLMVYEFEAPVRDIHLSIATMKNCAGMLLADQLHPGQRFPYIISPSKFELPPTATIQTGWQQKASDFTEWQAASGVAPGSVMLVRETGALTSDGALRSMWLKRSKLS